MSTCIHLRMLKAMLKKFIEYLQSKDTQNSLVKKLGYISIHDMKVTKKFRQCCY